MMSMMYQAYQNHMDLTAPWRSGAASALGYLNLVPQGVSDKLFGRLAAALELISRTSLTYTRPAYGIDKVMVGNQELEVTEEVVYATPFGSLLHFRKENSPEQPRMLLVAPMSGHFATLLRGTVKTLLQDHDVYITDWKNARTVPLEQGEFHLDDYVHYVEEFIRHLQGIYGNCHVISVCQPTVPVLAAVSLMASRGEVTPLTMTMMGGPIDARKSPTAVNNLAMNKSYEWFENNVIYRVPTSFPGAGRRVYAGFLQHTGFVAMNPDRHMSSHYDYFKHLIAGDDASAEAHRKFYDEYNAVLDMDADYYLETIRVVFQEFALVNGTWDVISDDGDLERVRPEDITETAHFTIEGELDDISGAGQTEAAHDLCYNVPKSRQKHVEVKGAGHYGIFSGRRWRDAVYPQVRDFILQFNEGPRVPVNAGRRSTANGPAAARKSGQQRSIA